MRSALEGIVVLDHTSALAGPYCAQLLGDFGANVIKIEQPGKGDQSRGWGPPFVGDVSAYYLGTNRNKRGLTLNLGSQDGRDIMAKLLKKADVLIHNVPRKSSRQKLGLDEKYCHGLNEKLIWASISGFGNTGPYAEKPGYDVIAQGMGGAMSLTGEKDSDPMRFPTPIADITTGIYTALSIVTALYARTHTGKGQSIDNALFDCQVTWLANVASSYLATNNPPQKIGNTHPSIVPYQPLPTADGWVIVGVGSEKLWQSFLQVINFSEIAEDKRFENNTLRLQHRQELTELLAKCLRQQNSAYWLEKLQQARIPSGPIYTPQETLSDEHLLSRGMVVELEHPMIGLVKSLGNPMNLTDTPVSYRLPPPLLGEHSTDILRELEYNEQQINELRDQKVI
ncbi:CaiB/BaiF CoA transferase family protein [Candidatus Uabimicrobium sp. HlEnr_7]|uniref:CaiB/BaiF CoA transferase family protein n=1 Tax=Candidatus Uabimicrobium helgolandensis TaxID=3095367 RepID=UPI0035569568